MNMKILVMAFAIILAIASVAVRVVLDTPQAFAETQTAGKNEMAHSHDVKGAMYMLDDLVIENVAARATIPGAQVAGGYMTITNKGVETDTLLTGTSNVADDLQIHEMKMEGDVMKMRQLDQGIVIAPGSIVALKPGGLHIMFMGLEAPLEKDTRFKATLNFEKAGAIDVEFIVMDAKHFIGGHSH